MNGSSDVQPSSRVVTMRWNGSALALIDQRHLPRRFEYVRCHTAAEVAAAIRSMVVRGAPAIACAAAYGIALECTRSAVKPESGPGDLESAFEVLAHSRPTAVNLFWALARMRARWERTRRAGGDIGATLLAEAHAIHAEDIAANRAMGKLGATLLHSSSRILTHCNAGALATAGHGTALGVIRSAVEAGHRVHVYVDETRPFLQGARLTAWELQQESIAVSLIPDGAAGYLMSRGEIDTVIVGADRVARNGDFANKIGTYMVAVLAHRHHIPFYVACPVSTIDPATPTGADIPIEERSAEEVTGFADLRWAPEGIGVRNPAFDVTPAELVTALITEHGIAAPPDTKKIAELLQAAVAARSDR
jgi:methylthioribose-1-phosphate isomerase